MGSITGLAEFVPTEPHEAALIREYLEKQGATYYEEIRGAKFISFHVPLVWEQGLIEKLKEAGVDLKENQSARVVRQVKEGK